MLGSGVRDSHRSLLDFLNPESAVINAIAKAASLSFTVSESTDHRVPHGFWWEYEPDTSIWWPLSGQAMNTNITTSGRMIHGHQRGIRLWHRSPISLWPSVVFMPWTLPELLAVVWLWTSTWPLATASITINIHRHQHGLSTGKFSSHGYWQHLLRSFDSPIQKHPHEPCAKAQTMDINKASEGNMDHGCLGGNTTI